MRWLEYARSRTGLDDRLSHRIALSDRSIRGHKHRTNAEASAVNYFATAGIWHPDNQALTKVRMAIMREAEQWAKVRKKLTLEGDSLTRPPRGFDPNHPFIDDIRMKDFVVSVALTEEQVCSGKLMRDFASACRKMSPLVEFTTKALGLKF
jgi:uncharacterized protein (TIGR02453 family)